MKTSYLIGFLITVSLAAQVGCAGGYTSTDSASTAPSSGGSGYSCGSTSISNLGSVASSVGPVGQSVAVNGSYAYLGISGATNGVQIVDISNSASPANVSFVSTQTGTGQIDPTSNDVLDILVEGNYLYATTYNGGLLIVDVTDPATPAIVGVLDLAAETWSVAKSGNYLYVGSTTAGLYVIDVTTSSTPSLVTTIATLPLRHMQIVGTKIYGSTIDRLQVVDIATPASPVLLGEFTIGSFEAYETYYSSGYLYALDKANKVLKTYSVSDPSNISLVDTSTAGLYDFRSIDGSGTKIYVSTGAGASGEIRVYDISNPATPTLDGIGSLTARGYEVSFQNGIVYTANNDGNLQVTRVCSN